MWTVYLDVIATCRVYPMNMSPWQLNDTIQIALLGAQPTLLLSTILLYT